MFRMREWLPVKLLFNFMLVAYFWQIASIKNGFSSPSILLIVAYIVSIGSFAYFVNDIFDIKTDKLSGKNNYNSNLPLVLKIIIPLLLLLIAIVPAVYYLPNYNRYLVLLLIHICTIVAYSIPWIRLKKNILGLLVDSFYAYVLPGVISIEIAIQTANIEVFSLKYFVPVLLWLGFVGLRSIINHQLKDFENDILANQETFITKIGKPRGKQLSVIIIVLELFLFKSIRSPRLIVRFLMNLIWIMTV